MIANVTICIPAFQAESFIDRTLTCARSQTYEHLRILVSVDYSDDTTVDICRQHAREDRRVEVIAQQERLGWSQNANAALDGVDTEFFFLYFHDDIIEPTYVERLLHALIERPDAATAHCDLVEFGLFDQLNLAHTYDGPPSHRLIEFLVSPIKGTTLRSLTRTSVVSNDLRFPIIPGDNHWSAYPFHLKQLAAGPAIGVHEPLYRRWQREGSLTKVWQAKDIALVVASQRKSACVCLDIIDRASTTEAEREAGRYCLHIFMLLFTRSEEIRLENDRLVNSQEISELFTSERRRPIGIETLTCDQQEWLRLLEGELYFLEANLQLKVGCNEDACSSLAAACAINSADLRARALQAHALHRSGLKEDAVAMAHQVLVVQPDNVDMRKLVEQLSPPGSP